MGVDIQLLPVVCEKRQNSFDIFLLLSLDVSKRLMHVVLLLKTEITPFGRFEVFYGCIDLFAQDFEVLLHLSMKEDLGLPDFLESQYPIVKCLVEGARGGLGF